MDEMTSCREKPALIERLAEIRLQLNMRLKQILREKNALPGMAVLLLLLNILVASIEWTDLREAREAAVATAEQQAERLSGALAGTASILLQKNDLVMKMMTRLYLRSRSTGTAIDQSQIAAMLDEIKPRGECGLCAFGILSGEGQTVLAWGSDQETLAGLSDRNGRAAKNRQQQISPIIRDGKTRGMLIVRPITLPSGRHGGISYARLDIGHLQASLPDGELGKNGLAYLLVPDDTASSVQIAGPSGDGISAQIPNFRPEPGILAGERHAAFTHLGTPNDGEHILAWHAIAGYPVLATVMLADTDYLTSWHARRTMTIRYLILISALSLLPVLALYWRQSRYRAARGSSQQSAADAEEAAISAGATTSPVQLRQHLQQQIGQARQERKTLAVCHLNIDDFDAVNSRHGREIGDRLLAGLGDFLRQEMRRRDIVAHLGGDEFVLILFPLDSLVECQRALERLLNRFAKPFRIGEQALSILPSIGVAIFPADDSEASTLLRHANRAMYRAKNAGGNRFAFFDPVADTSEKSRRHIVAQIRKGIEREEFRLHYQPKVDTRQGVVVGFEALIRWKHPEDGLLSPAHFLPMIEEDDLIVELGYWTLATALNDLAVWHRAGYPLSVSVNMATRHLQFPGFANRLAELLAEHPELPKGALELEILETTNMADLASAAEVIAQCIELGVSFALDDFGTGYSSLTYFRKLPVQSLKIDQTFVRDMLSDAEDFAIVEGLVLLGRSFSRRTVAEGVEDIETAMLLKALGCNTLQGYGIARPMPPERIFPWLREWPDDSWLHAMARKIEPEQVPLIVAEGHHRTWTRKLIACLDGSAEARPQLDPEACHVGRWCFHGLERNLGDIPSCADNRQLHEELHALAASMLRLLDEGRAAEAHAQIPEFVRLSEKMDICLRDVRLSILGIQTFPAETENISV